MLHTMSCTRAKGRGRKEEGASAQGCSTLSLAHVMLHTLACASRMEWKEVERWDGDAPHNYLRMRGRQRMAGRLVMIPASPPRLAHGAGPADQGPLLSGKKGAGDRLLGGFRTGTPLSPPGLPAHRFQLGEAPQLRELVNDLPCIGT